MLHEDFLINLIKENNYREIKVCLKDRNPADIAEMLESLEPQQALIIFRLLGKQEASMVFPLLSSKTQLELFSLVKQKTMTKVLEALNFDDKIDFLEELPPEAVTKLIENTPSEERKLINKFFNYPENSAGSLMTIEFLRLNRKFTVKETLVHIKKVALKRETIYVGYVTNKELLLEGVVSLKDIVTSEDDTKIEGLMETSFVTVKATDDQEHVAGLFKKYDLIALPVVDNEGKMLGIITFDDVMDVVDQEASEDLYRMGAHEPTDPDINYFDISAFVFFKKRILWLLILMFSETMTGIIIGKYQNAIESVVLLAAFIPMLMDNGGNAGSQSSVTVIRGLALGEIKPKDFFKVLKKEFAISLLCSFTLAGITFLRLHYIMKNNILLATTVSLTIIVTLIVANILGGILPLILTKLKIDPAVLSAPAISTILDSVTLIVYFSLATLILGLHA